MLATWIIVIGCAVIVFGAGYLVGWRHGRQEVWDEVKKAKGVVE